MQKTTTRQKAGTDDDRSSKVIMPPLPYPIKPKRIRFGGREYESFKDLLKKANLNISLFDLFANVPKYARFFKELLTKKEKFQDEEVVNISKKCSAIIKKDIQIPEKQNDPGSCTIPCEIEGELFKHALCDLGSGVSLMPLSVAGRLGILQDMKRTQVTLQLADKSLVKPDGIIEDVLIRVDKFTLPADFIILEMEEDKEVPLILGRPFLATGDAWIGVKDKIIEFNLNGEKVIFNEDYAMKHPREQVGCCKIDLLDECKNRHDQHIVHQGFAVGQKVLLFNSKLKIFAGKLQSKGSGPFLIMQVLPYGVLELKNAKTNQLFKVNGHRVKLYHEEVENLQSRKDHCLCFN